MKVDNYSTLSIILFVFVRFFCHGVESASLDKFGAIQDADSWAVATHNAEVFSKAVNVANNSVDNRVVEIPLGKTYYMSNVRFAYLRDITFRLDGTLIFSNDIDQYSEDILSLFDITDSEGIHFEGSGLFDGQGLNWWRLAYTGVDNRPHMIRFQTVQDISFRDVNLHDSPNFSIDFKDCANIDIHDITIFIDSSITRLGDRDSVTYALNTDGIDIAAVNVTVYNVNITNYDDAIVPKPCRSYYKYCQCSGNHLFYNNTVTYSTGLTIGSVPPNDDINCIRNVTFRDTVMYFPLKAIYIKSNPGDSGSGIIEDITYENIEIYNALWWTIWVGPQQQNQPGESSGTGCNFLFPKIPACPTNPLVSIKGVTFRNIHAYGTLPLFEGPGVFLCDDTTVCEDFVFENVTNEMFTGNITDILPLLPVNAPGVAFPTRARSDDWTFDYIVTNLYGTTSGIIDPPICVNDKACFWDGKSKN